MPFIKHIYILSHICILSLCLEVVLKLGRILQYHVKNKANQIEEKDSVPLVPILKAKQKVQKNHCINQQVNVLVKRLDFYLNV